MKPVSTSRMIAAPLDLVFRTISDARNFRDAVPHITRIEFLSDKHSGVGTRFRETRVMKGREETVELEVVEYGQNERIRLISDAGGTIWDTVFTVSDNAGKVEMKMQMDILPHTFMAKIMTRLIRDMVAKGVETDMDAVKAFCESRSEQAVTDER
jgi:uncharacterized membrane protein